MGEVIPFKPRPTPEASDGSAEPTVVVVRLR